MTDELKKNELAEEQLEKVSGGLYWADYTSGDTPRFHRGDRVVIHRFLGEYGMRKSIRYRAIIRQVSPKPYHGQFLYEVQHEDGGVECSVRESEMLFREQDGSWIPMDMTDRTRM